MQMALSGRRPDPIPLTRQSVPATQEEPSSPLALGVRFASAIVYVSGAMVGL